ncbi:MAG: helix-turn-helix transcriptional regulator [Flavobacteriaceae bacterium]|nr:helix-turn-helix transcriptional regulator [Flavobacteriaceae bacterium]
MNWLTLVFFVLHCVLSFSQSSTSQLQEKFTSSIECSKNKNNTAGERLQCAQEALGVAQLLDDLEKELIAFMQMASSLEDINRYKIALEYGYRGLELCAELGDLEQQAAFESICGRLYMKLKRPEEALQYLGRAQEYFGLTDNSAKEYIVLGNMAISYGMKEEYDKVEPLLKRIKNHYLKQEDTINYLRSVVNLATLFEKQEAVEKAFREIEGIKNFKLDTFTANSVKVIKGKLYKKVGDYDTAIQYLEKITYGGPQIGFRIMESSTKELAEMYSLVGNYEKASLYYKKNAQFKDSILSVNAQERLQELEILYQVSQKEKEIENLLFTKKRKNLQVLGLIALLFCVLITLLIIFFRTRRKIKNALLKSEKLAKKLMHRKNELANFAIHYSEVNRLIRTVNTKAEGIDHIQDLERLKTKIKELINELRTHNSLVQNNNNIEAYIDTAYSDFMYELELISTELTNKEKRICSLIVIDCSSKEIADILSISPKSINNARSIIRKKLNISEKENMNAFLKKCIHVLV